MIGILITLCSKNQDWEEIGDTDLIKDFLDAFIFTISGKHEYTFYLGYDENDDFFVKNVDKLKIRLPKAKVIVLPKTCNGNPCLGWTLLLEKAYNDGCEYFYQVGSDILHQVNNWDDYFIKIMKKNNNDAIAGGVDQRYWCERAIRDQSPILENVFFCRKHYERFGFLFPPEVKSWFSDDLLTKIYRNVDKVFVCPNIKFNNCNRVGDTNSKSRYVPPQHEQISKNWFIHANEYTKKGFPEIPIQTYNKKPIYN
jgi:hypothetical protein